MEANQLNTSLSEFTYTVVRQTPQSLRRHLPEKLYRATNTEKGAMRFSVRSTPEQKKEFFAYLGIEHYDVYIDTNKEEGSDFRRILSEIGLGDKPTEILQRLGESNVYICGNKEHAYLLGFVAQTMDTKDYVRSLELIRSSYHVKGFKSKIYIPEHAEANEARDNEIEVSKLMNAMFWGYESCEDILEIDNASLRVLIYFSINRGSYRSQEKVVKAFAGAFSKKAVTGIRIKLLNWNLISRHPLRTRDEYTITAKGILTINKFREKVIKSLDF